MEKKKRNAEHIRNLILLALSDNQFHELEMELIIKVATRLGISCKEFETFVDSEPGSFEVPQLLSKKIEQLHDLVSVMMIDGVVHKEEEKLLMEFIRFYGLNVESKNKHLSLPFDQNLRKKRAYNDFIKTFRLMTAEKISEVWVDNNYQIKLPLYKSEIKVNPLAKTLYIFFLKNPEGCEVKTLYKFKDQLCHIYSEIPGAHLDVCQRIGNLIHYTGETFNQNRSRIHSAIKKATPKNNNKLEENYFIQRDDSARMHLKLKKELIVIQPAI